MTTGLELIAQERKRQIEEIGYTLEHDLGHSEEELALAATVYTAPPKTREETGLDMLWPPDWWFNSDTTRIGQLTRAGALIAAELDRLLAAK